VGMTESFEMKHHYQSYFLLMNRGMLQNRNFQVYWSNVSNYQTKPDVVVAYEINLLEQCLSWGLNTDALFANPALATWPHNPTLTLWQGLIEAGFPFIKAQLLKQNPYQVDISAWTSFVKDPELLSAINHDLAGGR
jgi:lipopolysaccharide biosynthesis protein